MVDPLLMAFREFNHFLDSNGLLDLGFVGPRFTSCNNRSGSARVWEIIDRVFAIPGWLSLYPNHLVHHFG